MSLGAGAPALGLDAFSHPGVISGEIVHHDTIVSFREDCVNSNEPDTWFFPAIAMHRSPER